MIVSCLPRRMYKKINGHRAKRLLLVALLLLLVAATRIPAQAQTGEPPECANYTTCIDLFGNNVAISEIRARSSLPVFQAPLLQVEFEILAGTDAPPYGLYTGFRQLQPPDATGNATCELVIAGLQSPTAETLEVARVIPIEDSSGSQIVNLFGFCRGMNLPGTGGRPFPTSEDDLTTDYQSGLSEPGQDTQAALDTLVERIQNGTCPAADGSPLTIGSLATQFAVFLLFAEADSPGATQDMWQEFQIDAGNTVYTREQDAIYCLLEGSVQRPAPTPTPTPTPTPEPEATPALIPPTRTPQPFNQPIIPTGGDSDLSIAQFGTLLSGVMAGIVLTMVGLISLKSRRIRRVVIAILIVVIVALVAWLAGVSLAQDGVIPTPDAASTPTTAPASASGSDPRASVYAAADTAPPPLMMIVVVDESGTMQNGTNSILPTGGSLPAGFGRLSTDPEDRRLEAVIDLAARLQGDRSTTHQLAVLTFARSSEIPEWLTPEGWADGSADGTPSNIFTQLGAGVDSSDFETFTNRLRQPRGWRDAISGGAGNPAEAMTFVQTALTDTLRDRPPDSIKPVVLFITDDVPMSDFSSGPWVSPGLWSGYLTEFEAPLLALSATSLYQGYCAKPNGGVTIASFPMGAANWVNADGTTQGVNDADAGTGDYFTDLATRLGAVNPVNGDTLVYPIDPLFSDGGFGQNEADFDAAVTGLLRGLRCTDRVEIATTTEGLDAVGNVPVSAFHSHVTITADVNPDQQVEIVPPGGASLGAASNITRTEVIPAGSTRKRVTFGLNRSDFSPGEWAGVWQLRVEGTQIAVIADAVVDLSGVTVVDRTPVTSVEPGQPVDLSYEVFTNGYPVQPGDSLLASVTGSEPSTGAFDLSGEDAAFTTRLGDGFTDAGRYNVSITINVQNPATVPLPETEVYNERLTTIAVASGFILRRTVPDNNTVWDCEQGQQELSAIVELGSESASQESVGSYTRIDVYYPPRAATDGDSAATPIAQLAWQEAGRFSNTIDCSIFTGGDNEIEIVAVFPNNAESNRSVNFTFQPTPTPTQTPMPEATIAPTATPPPPGPDLVGNVGESVLRPPLSVILIGIAVMFLGITTIRLTTIYFRTLLPLYNVWLEVNASPRQRLLGPLRRYVPLGLGHYRNLITVTATGERIPVARINGQPGGVSIRITALAPNGVVVNGDYIAAGDTDEKRDEEIRINYEDTTFTLVNRNARY